MAMVNERAWNSLQSGLLRVKEDIKKSSSPTYAPVRSNRSPRLPRLAHDDGRPSSGDLRRAKFGVVPPLNRSMSLESLNNEDDYYKPRPRRNPEPKQRADGVFTPPTYFNRHENPRPRVPNTSISNFMPKKHRDQYPRDDDSPAEAEKLRAFRQSHPKPRFNFLDEDLAPTPEPAVERKRRINLRGSQTNSLDAVIDRYKTDPYENPQSPLLYKPMHGERAWSADSDDSHNLRVSQFPREGGGDQQPVSDDPELREALDHYVDQLVEETLEEEIIPDLLIDTIMELKASQTPSQPATLLPVEELRPRHLTQSHPLMNPRVNPGVPVIPPFLAPPDDFLFPSSIGDPFLGEPIARAVMFDAMEKMVESIVDENIPDVVREGVFEVIVEDYINTDIMPEVLREMSREVAIDTLTKIDSRVESKQKRSVNSFAKDRVLDSFSLEHILNLVANSGRIFTTDKRTEQLLDDVILNQLLGQYLNVRSNLNFTIRNQPLRRLHEKLVTDVALDVVLEELEAQLDEDLEDLHEYETSLDDPRLLEKSLKVATNSEKLPEGLKDWIRSVDATLAPPAPSRQPDQFTPKIEPIPPEAESRPEVIDELPNVFSIGPDQAVGSSQPAAGMGQWAWLFAE